MIIIADKKPITLTLFIRDHCVNYITGMTVDKKPITWYPDTSKPHSIGEQQEQLCYEIITHNQVLCNSNPIQMPQGNASDDLEVA